MGVYLCCLCCLTTQKAKCLEITLAVTNVISFISFIWCFGCIPWKSIPKSGLVFFIIDFILLIFELLAIVYCLILRHKNLINNSRNYSAKILSYIMLCLTPLGVICIIIGEYITLNRMNKIEADYLVANLYNPNINKEYDSPITNSNWYAAKGGPSIIEIAWLFSICLWIVESKLIRHKTDGPYTKYINEVNQINQINNVQRQVQIIQDNNGLVFLGNDEYGRPVYAQAGYQQNVNPYPNMVVGNAGFASGEELNNRNNIIPNPLDQDVSNNDINKGGNNNAFYEKPQMNNYAIDNSGK